MTERTSVSTVDPTEELFETTVREILAGRSKKDIIRELTRAKWSPESAREFTNHCVAASREHRHSPEGLQAVKDKALNQAISGLIFVVAGFTGANVILKMNIANGAEYIAYFACIWGIYDLVCGLSLYLPMHFSQTKPKPSDPLAQKK